MYEVLYRKHRPRNFNGVIGQEHVTLPLKKALEKGSCSHAYVFAGPRGTGKTSTARILAKYLNCSSDDKPCGKCDSCLSIDRASHMDVVELDAASYRGIDEIRKIRDAAGYRPVMGKTKVYIIDEFHMLTREAFNALLKTLEEPPQNTVFILATTNLEKVPDTVISRCQVFQFRSLSDMDIEEYLTMIAEKEGIAYSEGVLKLIARHARGSMRDGVNVLERVSSVSSEITLDDVHKILGLVPEETVSNYLSALTEGIPDMVIQISSTITHNGLSFDQLTVQLLDLLKTRLVNGEMTLEEGVKVGSAAWEIHQELRNAMDKRGVFEVLSIMKMQRLRSSRQDSSASNIVEPVKKLSEEIAPPEKAASETEKKTEKSGFADFLDELYEKGQIVTWSVLKMANAKEDDNVVALMFPQEAHFARRVFEEEREMISSEVQKCTGRLLQIEDEAETTEERDSDDSSRGKPHTKPREKDEVMKLLTEDQREYVNRIVRLFGDDVELSVDKGEEE